MAAWQAGTWIVLLPAVAAVFVLVTAALIVDYFGLLRRREDWSGTAGDARAAWLRARAHAHRFRSLKRRGSPRTSRAARSLLLSLAECERLEEATEVVDFLGADAVFARVGGDPVGDAMRAIALAELGRLDEARKLAGKLLAARRCGRRPVVRYAWARVAELDRRPHDALAKLDPTLIRHVPRGLMRDVHVLRARALVRIGRTEAAADALRELVGAGCRRDVERLADRSRERGEAGVAMAASYALSASAPYR
jgi:hypothetical protein